MKSGLARRDRLVKADCGQKIIANLSSTSECLIWRNGSNIDPNYNYLTNSSPVPYVLCNSSSLSKLWSAPAIR